ncbi:hypothetical protein ACPEIC_43595 [Stenotrophomonas sp. NPDC087984]
MAEVSRVLLNALDCLPPPERGVFVLHDAFGMAPGTVADIVGRTEPECAELADRAHHSLRMRRSRPTTPDEHDALAHAVRRACVGEDAELLASLLCPDATAFFDGGGKVRTPIRPAHGSRRVAHSLLTLLAQRPRTTPTTHSVDGRTGLVARYDRQVAAVISLDITDHRVAQVWVVLNPEKPRSWNQPPEKILAAMSRTRERLRPRGERDHNGSHQHRGETRWPSTCCSSTTVALRPRSTTCPWTSGRRRRSRRI